MTLGRLHVLALAGLAVLLGLSLSLGTSDLGPWDMLSGDPQRRALAVAVIWELRCPRTLLAATTGASLGLAGAVLQGLFRNPLADPGIVGVSATAALGAVLAFHFGTMPVPAGGIAGGLAAVLLLAALAGRGAGTLVLLLAGAALSSFSVALTSLALNLAPSPFAAYEIMFWLLGAVADRSWTEALTALPLVLIGWALLLATGRGLAALTLGEDVARSLGIEMTRLRWAAIGGTACCVGASVAVAGGIGFVGLVVPHLLRPLVGHDPQRLLPLSAMGGAALLLAADVAVRIVPAAQELKLGVVTALVGAPFFLWQVLRLRGSG
jgi:iron complex transport system permease protein